MLAWPRGVTLALAFASVSAFSRGAEAQVAAPTALQPEAATEGAARDDASSEAPDAGTSSAAVPGVAPTVPAGDVASTGPGVAPTAPAAARPKSPSEPEWDVAAPGGAKAPSLAPADEPPVETRTRWYGWQTLPVDALAVTFISLSFCEETSTGDGDCSSSSTYQALGLLAYGAGAPTIHVLNRNGPSAVASVGLRLGMPLVGGLLGGALGSGEDAAGSGVAVFAVGAMLIDAAFLARVEVPVKRVRSASLAPSPWVAPGRLGAGLSGSF